MRNSTFGIILIALIFVPTYFAKEIVAFAGYPDIKWSTARGVVGLFATIFAVVVLAILAALNPRILEWRKAGGRDIEAEERHESAHGMISLNPTDNKREDDQYFQ